MTQLLYILSGWLFTIAGAYALGRILWTRLHLRLTRDEEIPLAFVLGAGPYSLIILFLGFAQLYHRGIFIALAACSLLAAWRLGALTLPAERLAPLPRWLRRATTVLATLFGVLYLSNALAPEVSPDGSTYHLGLVARYYREHAMVPVHTNLYAALSQGAEMLFLSAFSFGRHSAAAMVHCTFLFALPWMMANWARRHGHPLPGVAAALLVFLAPVVGLDGISAYNDVAGAAVVFAFFVLLDRWDETRQPSLLLAIGVLAGFSYGIKYTLVLSLPFAVLWVYWRERRLRPVLQLAAVAALFIAPWVCRNAVWWHNPVAPLFNAWFPNPYVHQWFEKEYKAHMATYGLPSRWLIPAQITYGGSKLAGLLGPVFLLSPLALLSLRHPLGPRLLLTWAVFTATYFSNVGTRFLIPGLPFLALAFALLPWPRLVLATVVLHAVLSWPDVIKLYADRYSWRLEKVLWREALRLKPEDHFLSSRLAAYPIARLIDAHVPAGRRIFSFQQIPEAYCSREVIVGFQSAQGELLEQTMHNALREDRKPTRLLHLTFPPRKLDHVRIALNRDWPAARWSVHEIRLLHDNEPIARSPHWRIHATTAPELAPLVVDNSPVTRWTADVPWLKGQGFTLDLGRPTPIDHVIIEMSSDQAWDGITLEGIPEAKTELKAVPTPVGLRRAVMEEFLARNVQFLVSEQGEYWYRDLLSRPEAWGLDVIGTRGAHTLFRILSPSEFARTVKKK